MKRIVHFLLATVLVSLSTTAAAGWGSWFSPGLNDEARAELKAAGLDKYVGKFTPTSSEDAGDGWVRHRFAKSADGPLCIAGTEYSVFTKVKNPHKLLFFTQGGGACWQDFYNCNVVVDDPNQLPPPPPVGLWSDNGLDTPIGNIPNPLADYSIVYLPYCDGSVFTGDIDVYDPAFGAEIGVPEAFVRFHRGLRNLSAGMDVAKHMFPHPRRIVVAGSSAGGVGAATWTPFLARILYGNWRDLAVFNDAGPNAINLLDIPAILARGADWQSAQFFPASCTDCAVDAQGTKIVEWRLANDRTIREAFYSTDADGTNRFFLKVPTQEMYRDLILGVHGEINAAHPFRYKRFIQSGSTTHTAIQTPLLYVGTAAGIPLNLWTADFLEPPIIRFIKAWLAGRLPVWIDAVDDFVPAPPPQ